MFNQIFAALTAKGGKSVRLMIDVTLLKAHRPAANLLFPEVSGAPQAT